MKEELRPATEASVQQYGSKRPLRVRQVAKSLLHDRLLVVDGKEAWDISQSLNASAKGSPATITKSRADRAELKVATYEPLFDEAISLVRCSQKEWRTPRDDRNHLTERNLCIAPMLAVY
ncbi:MULTISPECIES: hypothetical protein [Sphingobium]|uniref:hypothetical protein n=1 Tax=Sphingobium sp. MI1205 TaxID=407020 RepID=UPI0011A89A0D|nr:hypothetical protein [Sphingobium sp. MI1205]